MPLLPRAAVLPWPLPGPRPIRLVLCVEPESGLSVLMPDIFQNPPLLNDPHQVRNLRDHTPGCRGISYFTRRIQLIKTQAFHDKLLVDIEPDRTSVILNLEFARSRSLLLSC